MNSKIHINGFMVLEALVVLTTIATVGLAIIITFGGVK